MPIPLRTRSRWAHMRRNRGSMYSSCANSTCSFASLDRARVAKMSRMSSVRSMTRKPVASSMLLALRRRQLLVEEVVSDACDVSIRVRSSSIFPRPRYVAGSGRSRRCVISSTTMAPAVSTSWASSAECSSAWCRSGERFSGARTRTARSTGGSREINSREIGGPPLCD